MDEALQGINAKSRASNHLRTAPGYGRNGETVMMVTVQGFSRPT